MHGNKQFVPSFPLVSVTKLSSTYHVWAVLTQHKGKDLFMQLTVRSPFTAVGEDILLMAVPMEVTVEQHITLFTQSRRDILCECENLSVTL